MWFSLHVGDRGGRNIITCVASVDAFVKSSHTEAPADARTIKRSRETTSNKAPVRGYGAVSLHESSNAKLDLIRSKVLAEPA